MARPIRSWHNNEKVRHTNLCQFTRNTIHLSLKYSRNTVITMQHQHCSWGYTVEFPRSSMEIEMVYIQLVCACPYWQPSASAFVIICSMAGFAMKLTSFCLRWLFIGVTSSMWRRRNLLNNFYTYPAKEKSGQLQSNVSALAACDGNNDIYLVAKMSISSSDQARTPQFISLFQYVHLPNSPPHIPSVNLQQTTLRRDTRHRVSRWQTLLPWNEKEA